VASFTAYQRDALDRICLFHVAQACALLPGSLLAEAVLTKREPTFFLHACVQILMEGLDWFRGSFMEQLGIHICQQVAEVIHCGHCHISAPPLAGVLDAALVLLASDTSP
jgi:hypothetical protein